VRERDGARRTAVTSERAKRAGEAGSREKEERDGERARKMSGWQDGTPSSMCRAARLERATATRGGRGDVESRGGYHPSRGGTVVAGSRGSRVARGGTL